MQTFISDIIPKIQLFSQKLDDLTILTNQHWVVMDEIDKTKNVYIFRKNNELLVSSNGEVEKGRWEYLGNNSLLIDKKDKSYLFKHGFFDENVLVLKIDGREEYAFLVNENKYDGELNSFKRVIDFLNRTYLDPSIQKKLEGQYGLERPIVIQKTPEELERERKKKSDDEARNFMVFVLIVAIIFGLTLLINHLNGF
jgi:hypothetical protein